jgi:hypothetical protein
MVAACGRTCTWRQSIVSRALIYYTSSKGRKQTLWLAVSFLCFGQDHYQVLVLPLAAHQREELDTDGWGRESYADLLCPPGVSTYSTVLTDLSRQMPPMHYRYN